MARLRFGSSESATPNKSVKKSSKKSSKRSTVAARRTLRSDGGSGGLSNLNDLTRPIARDRRLLRSRVARWLVPVGAVGIVTAFAFVLFVRPVQTYFDQNRAIEERTMQYDQIVTVNGQLRTEVERLQTPDGVREAAREQVGYVAAGEERLTVNPTGQVPTELPAGWPYNMATAIFATRTTTPSAAPSDSSSDSPTASSVPTVSTPPTSTPPTTQP